METIQENNVGEKIDFGTPKPMDNLNSILSDYKDVTPPVENSTVTQPPVDVYKTGKKAGQPRKIKVSVNPTQQTSTLTGEILTGALFLTLIDLIIPIVIVGMNNRFSKDKIKTSDLQLTAKQKAELAPIADRVVKQLNIEANPNLLLFVSMIGIYGANYTMLKLSNSKTQNNEKNNKENSEIKTT